MHFCSGGTATYFCMHFRNDDYEQGHLGEMYVDKL